MIRNRINPNLENLDELNHKYQWIPGKENIRPSEEIINKKDKWIENLSNFYENEKFAIYVCVGVGIRAEAGDADDVLDAVLPRAEELGEPPVIG